MTENTKCSAEKLMLIEEYLRGYLLNLRLVELDGYEKDMFLEKADRETEMRELEADFDLALSQARLFEIRHFVLSMPNTEEKLFLYYRYIRGQTVENCAELLGVSRSTAYRLKDRALAAAAQRYAEDTAGTRGRDEGDF